MTNKIKATEVLEKHIAGENGISYTLGEDGLYYPDLRFPEGTYYEIGRYGQMRGEYLKEYRRELYQELLLHGKLNEYLPYDIFKHVSVEYLHLPTTPNFHFKKPFASLEYNLGGRTVGSGRVATIVE